MIKTARQLKDLIRNLSKDKSADAQILMRNYMMERFLERISLSEYRDKFILKGGMLVAAMVGLDARSTMDIDATVKGATVGIEEVENMIASIISVPVDDGVEFRLKRISEIMDEAEYPGIRVSMETEFDGVITPLKIDISTGDAITPHEVRYSFTGIKYHSTLQNYYQQIRGISDRLCAENGLSVILQGERTKTVSYIEWLRQSKGQPTFRSMLEADLRDAITDANDLGHFFLLMEHKGYEIHHGNRLGFRLRGQERYMYPERKNAAFSEENIERTIAGNLAEIEAGIRPAFLPRPKPQPYRPHSQYKGFLALYYHYCYLLGRIEKRQYPPRMTPHLRQEIMKAETYKARLKFLQENNITTADDLTACMQRAENAVAQLAKQRTILNVRKKKRKKLFDALATEESLAVSKALYEEGLSGMEAEYAQYAEAKAILDACGVSRKTLTEEKADIYEQLAQLNKQIRAERQKIKLCREIADSAAVMQRDVAAQEKSRHEKESSQTRDHE